MDIQIIKLSDEIWSKTLRTIKHDIYQLPDYFALEAARSKSIAEAILLQDSDKIMFIPYLLRSCEDVIQNSISMDYFDVVSPYGYPGILFNEAALKTPGFPDIAVRGLSNFLKTKGVCSAFFRLHPTINNDICQYFKNQHLFQLNGKTISINLKLSETEIWNQTKRDRRKKINNCLDMGLTARMVDFRDYVDNFANIYQETMERVGAEKIYYSFNYGYFMEMENVLRKNLHLCIVEIDNQVASAGLYTEYCGIVQGIFRGTKTKFLELSPGSLEIDYVRFWAKQRGNDIFHLGGGVGSAINNLYNFKASFSKQRHQFITMRLIIDENKYMELVKMRAKDLNIDFQQLMNSNYFPVYRYTFRDEKR
ncbi:MAG: peptidoglycan bridge formation glycyltransferase FemA/FemB family protein [Nostocaceae cyanobacterium]|nr:peptidoglycan bridge formation glycyltransferase FemA/FemB family protein [Nostocaceae cyanobacterium]